MRKHKILTYKLLLRAAYFLTTLITVSGCTSFPRIYSGEAAHGWVIDSETKLPIKDAVVVIRWELKGGLIHTDHTANIHIAESVTDESGYYSFKKWGPKFTTDGRMSDYSPQLVFYKFGYDNVSLANKVVGNLHPDNSISEHSGKKIELSRLKGEIHTYPRQLSGAFSLLQLSSYREPFQCMWTLVPFFTLEIIKTEKFFKQHNIYSSFPSMSSLSAPKCQNPEKILKEYIK